MIPRQRRRLKEQMRAALAHLMWQDTMLEAWGPVWYSPPERIVWIPMPGEEIIKLLDIRAEALGLRSD